MDVCIFTRPSTHVCMRARLSPIPTYLPTYLLHGLERPAGPGVVGHLEEGPPHQVLHLSWSWW